MSRAISTINPASITMQVSRILPAHVQEKVRTFPESSYGATRVVVVLADGTRVRDVYVAWCEEIVKIGSVTDRIWFDVSSIVDVEIG